MSEDRIWAFKPAFLSVLRRFLEIVDFPLPGSPVTQTHQPSLRPVAPSILRRDSLK